jgi:hypothetical protein
MWVVFFDLLFWVRIPFVRLDNELDYCRTSHSSRTTNQAADA